MKREKIIEVFSKYLTPLAAEICANWVIDYRIMVKIKNSRSSKFGDYRPPFDGEGHTITINYDLNPHAFLITFTHEVAHLTCFLKYKNTVAAHGKEWKKEFQLLLIPLIQHNLFPDEICSALTKYIQDPAASSCSDIALMKALRNYDIRVNDWVHLEDIPSQTVFEIKSGEQFIKGEKLKKNYSCVNVRNNSKYTIHPMMEVKKIVV